MEASDVLSGVRQAWQFLFTPLLLASATGLISLYLAGPFVLRRVGLMMARAKHAAAREDVRAALEFYGLAKLAPAISLIGIIFLLYVFQSTALAIGNRLPGRLTYMPVEMFLALAPSEVAVELWSQFPHAPSAADLPSLLASVESQGGALHPDRSYWEGSLDTANIWFDASKFLLIYSWVILLVARAERSRNACGRALLVSALLICLGATLFVRQIYCREQAFYERMHRIEAILYASREKTDAGLRSQLNNRYQSELRGRTEQGGTAWWTFTLVRPYGVQWAWRTLTGGDS
jgi:hypothetical protein